MDLLCFSEQDIEQALPGVVEVIIGDLNFCNLLFAFPVIDAETRNRVLALSYIMRLHSHRLDTLNNSNDVHQSFSSLVGQTHDRNVDRARHRIGATEHELGHLLLSILWTIVFDEDSIRIAIDLVQKNADKTLSVIKLNNAPVTIDSTTNYIVNVDDFSGLRRQFVTLYNMRMSAIRLLTNHARNLGHHTIRCIT